ncbi:MAG: hypothetical protein FJ038_11260 [Chloroflexi bacterium]|nr:hypothetical protein [Chloroflexota bacterium]
MSWVDRLIRWIEALPGPAWVTYAVAFAAVLLGTHLPAWADGFLPLGAVDAYLASLAIYVVGPIGAIHVLDRAAARAWATFSRATRLSSEESARAGRELTEMPAWPTAAWSMAGVALALVYTVGQYGAPLDLEGEPLTFLATLAISLVSFGEALALVYHTVRQLRFIARIDGYVETVDLLDLQPLHAFAGFTAATGSGLLAFAYLSAATDPATFTNPALFAGTLALVGLAVACFVVPLLGMHGRIVAEKSRRMAAANARLTRALADLDRRADTSDLTDADAFTKHLAGLITQRDLLARVSTWPWQPDTVRWFGTALVLPVGLWLVFRLLERALG